MKEDILVSEILETAQASEMQVDRCCKGKEGQVGRSWTDTASILRCNKEKKGRLPPRRYASFLLADRQLIFAYLMSRDLSASLRWADLQSLSREGPNETT